MSSTSSDLIVRSGNGWATVDTAGIQQTPGAHDIGKPLGMLREAWCS
jgi:hypothetical protein